MTCRVIEQMIKEVEEQTRKQTNLQIIQHFFQTGKYSLDELFKVLKISGEDQPRYLEMLKEMEQREEKEDGQENTIG